jgi:hypothetical protein
MNQVNARHEIIGEWRSLPKERRQTAEQAAGFAMQIKDNTNSLASPCVPVSQVYVGCG